MTTLNQIGALMQQAEFDNDNKVGKFRKFLFHVHGPASYDYDIISDNPQVTKKVEDDYSISEIVSWGKLQGLFVPEINDSFFHDFDAPFTSEKDFAGNMLMAAKLSQSGIEAVVLTDHNTIEGISKLQKACYLYHKTFSNSIQTHVISGVEVSCADQVHVVAMFENETVSIVDKWLSETLINTNLGTYLTAQAVIQQLSEQGCLVYPAHLATSKLIRDTSFSGAYKQHLFSTEKLVMIGADSPSNAQYVNERISNWVKRRFPFVRESDSHSVPTIGDRYAWVLCDTPNFMAIKSMFLKPQLFLCNDDDEPEQPISYIQSVYIQGLGFLRGEDRDELVIPFSNRLNTLIGGRGTGKSTVLQEVSLLLSQGSASFEEFQHILDQGTVCLHLKYNNDDYFLLFNGSKDSINDRQFLERMESVYKPRTGFYWDRASRNQRQQLINTRIQIFRGALDLNCQLTKGRREILDLFYTQLFSMSDLINLARENRSNQFVQEMLYRSVGSKIKEPNFRATTFNLVNAEKNFTVYARQRKKTITEYVSQFNQLEDSILRLDYSQHTNPDDLVIENFWHSALFDNGMKQLKQKVGDFNVNGGGVIALFTDISGAKGFLNTVSLLENESLDLFNDIDPRNYELDFQIERSALKHIADDPTEFIKLLRHLTKTNNISIILKRTVSSMYTNIDQFDLHFNINSQSGVESKRKPIFKDVSQLSMGQTVIAMMSFILAFGRLTGNEPPLILDQPEDNLDSRYIYRNLVRNLIDSKVERQIILATHNSTLVVNSGAEQVIVMDSDNNKGWVKKVGYSGKKSILMEVINLLEGGRDAFDEKLKIYEIADGKKHVIGR